MKTEFLSANFQLFFLTYIFINDKRNEQLSMLWRCIQFYETLPILKYSSHSVD